MAPRLHALCNDSIGPGRLGRQGVSDRRRAGEPGDAARFQLGD
jgi:hypothetical protein